MKKTIVLALGLGLCACGSALSDGVGSAMRDAGAVLAEAGSWMSEAGTAHAQTREFIEVACDAMYEHTATFPGGSVHSWVRYAFLPGSDGATAQDLLRVRVVTCDWTSSSDPGECPEGATCAGSRAPTPACTVGSSQLVDGRIGVYCGQAISDAWSTYGRAVFERG